MSREDAVRSSMVACACLWALGAAGCSGGGSATSAVHQAWSYQSQRAITAVLQPADDEYGRNVYRGLLPGAFDMPLELRLLVAVVSYDDVTSPLVPYREGYVMLACRYQGAAGWYTLTMPVTDPTANDGGRAIGFPKYVADGITLTQPGGSGWVGEVVHQQRSVLRLELAPLGSGTSLTTVGQPGPPAFTLVPPGQGPEVYEVDVDLHQPQRVSSAAGTASVTSQALDPWAALLVGARVESAQYAEIAGDWNLVASKR